MKKVFLLLSVLLNTAIYAQTVELYRNDFESGVVPVFQQGTSNTSILGTCAGNGGSSAGTHALYTTKGGVNPGCGVDGNEQYAFQEAAMGVSEQIIQSVLIDGKCTWNHKLSFDYKFSIDQLNARAMVGYKVGAGPWMIVDTLDRKTDWTAVEYMLPSATFTTEFQIGMLFEYNFNTASGLPLAVDNIVVEGETGSAKVEADIIPVCNQNTTIVSANPYYAGTGSWSLISGGGTLNNSASHTTGINNLPMGTSVFVWSVVSADCGNSSDTVTIINSIAPSAANVQDTFFACALPQIHVSTATPSSGTGIWTSPENAVFANPTSPATLVTTIPKGWSQFIWTISTPGCPAKADTMHVFNTGGQKFLNADTSICLGQFAELIAVTPSIDSMQTATMLFATGGGTMTQLTDDSVRITNLQSGMNQIIYQVTHQLCPKESDTLNINLIPCSDFEPIFPTVITPNGDGFNDVFMIQNLENVYPECSVIIFNRYGKVVFESIGYSQPWDGTFKGEKLPMGAYFFKLELNDSEQQVFNGTISLIH